MKTSDHSENFELNNAQHNLQPPRRVVLTGAPCSGKTIMLEALDQLGYLTAPETAREVIRSFHQAGRDLRLPEVNREANRLVLSGQISKEASIPFQTPAVLDRALGDVLTYLELEGEPIEDLSRYSIRGRYAKALVFDPLPFVTDAQREIADEDFRRVVDRRLECVYREANVAVVRIPVSSVNDRLKLVLDEIRRAGVYPVKKKTDGVSVVWSATFRPFGGWPNGRGDGDCQA